MPFEIHLHGDIPLREDVGPQQLHEALRPLWQYAGASSFREGCVSAYEEEPGMVFHLHEAVLQVCWTVPGNDDFRQALSDACMNLNELCRTGAAFEVSFYDTEFDEEDAEPGQEAKDDFWMCFVGPSPADIMAVQRDMLIHDVTHMMQRHFDPSELGPVVQAIDQLFQKRLQDLALSMQWGMPPRNGGASGHGGAGRKPRHLH